MQSSSRARSVILGLVILALFIVGGVAISQSPDDESDSAASEVSEDTATTETTEARSTVGDAQSTQLSTTTPAADTLLGEPTNWFLVIQSSDGIVRVDVDTGQSEDLGLYGVLLGQAWGRVLVRRLNGDLSTVDFEQLGGETPVELSLDSDGSALGSNSRVIQGSRPGMAWIVSDFNDTAWQVDLSSGQIVRTVDLDQSTWFEVSPDFLTPAAGGIYELQDDDSYRLALDGRILAEAPGRILVNRCDESLACANQWVDPDTFENLPQFFLPKFAYEGWFPQVLPGGRFLTAGPQDVVDSVTGEQHRLQTIETNLVWDRGLVISPDGKVVALNPSPDQLRVRLMDGDGPAVRVEGLLLRSSIAAPIFVPRSSD